ncbi:MAG: hypothetical protein ABI548_26725 [Polyangiaceae bacterium]
MAKRLALWTRDFIAPGANARTKGVRPRIDRLKDDTVTDFANNDLVLVVGKATVLGEADRLAPAIPKQLRTLGHA